MSETIKRYHVFGSDEGSAVSDDWYGSLDDAVAAYNYLMRTSKRLYLEEFASAEDLENDIRSNEECLAADGEYPA